MNNTGNAVTKAAIACATAAAVTGCIIKETVREVPGQAQSSSQALGPAYIAAVGSQSGPLTEQQINSYSGLLGGAEQTDAALEQRIRERLLALGRDTDSAAPGLQSRVTVPLEDNQTQITMHNDFGIEYVVGQNMPWEIHGNTLVIPAGTEVSVSPAKPLARWGFSPLDQRDRQYAASLVGIVYPQNAATGERVQVAFPSYDMPARLRDIGVRTLSGAQAVSFDAIAPVQLVAAQSSVLQNQTARQLLEGMLSSGQFAGRQQVGQANVYHYPTQGHGIRGTMRFTDLDARDNSIAFHCGVPMGDLTSAQPGARYVTVQLMGVGYAAQNQQPLRNARMDWTTVMRTANGIERRIVSYIVRDDADMKALQQYVSERATQLAHEVPIPGLQQRNK